jgi:hypothetical protein
MRTHCFCVAGAAHFARPSDAAAAWVWRCWQEEFNALLRMLYGADLSWQVAARE